MFERIACVAHGAVGSARRDAVSLLAKLLRHPTAVREGERLRVLGALSALTRAYEVAYSHVVSDAADGNVGEFGSASLHALADLLVAKSHAQIAWKVPVEEEEQGITYTGAVAEKPPYEGKDHHSCGVALLAPSHPNYSDGRWRGPGSPIVLCEFR